MDDDNPFSPGYGETPPYLAGRDEVINTAIVALRRGPGRAQFHQFLLGPRGCGKTTTLNAITDLAASEHGAVVIRWTAGSRPLLDAATVGAGDAERRLRSRWRRAGAQLDGSATVGVPGVASATARRHRPAPARESTFAVIERLATLAARRHRTRDHLGRRGPSSPARRDRRARHRDAGARQRAPPAGGRVGRRAPRHPHPLDRRGVPARTPALHRPRQPRPRRHRRGAGDPAPRGRPANRPRRPRHARHRVGRVPLRRAADGCRRMGRRRRPRRHRHGRRPPRRQPPGSPCCASSCSSPDGGRWHHRCATTCAPPPTSRTPPAA